MPSWCRSHRRSREKSSRWTCAPTRAVKKGRPARAHRPGALRDRGRLGRGPARADPAEPEGRQLDRRCGRSLAGRREGGPGQGHAERGSPEAHRGRCSRRDFAAPARDGDDVPQSRPKPRWPGAKANLQKAIEGLGPRDDEESAAACRARRAGQGQARPAVHAPRRAERRPRHRPARRRRQLRRDRAAADDLRRGAEDVGRGEPHREQPRPHQAGRHGRPGARRLARQDAARACAQHHLRRRPPPSRPRSRARCPRCRTRATGCATRSAFRC